MIQNIFGQPLPGSGWESHGLAKRREIVVIDNGSGFIWHFSGLDKYLVKYLVSVGLGNKNSCYSTLDLTWRLTREFLCKIPECFVFAFFDIFHSSGRWQGAEVRINNSKYAVVRLKIIKILHNHLILTRDHLENDRRSFISIRIVPIELYCCRKDAIDRCFAC